MGLDPGRLKKGAGLEHDRGGRHVSIESVNHGVTTLTFASPRVATIRGAHHPPQHPTHAQDASQYTAGARARSVRGEQLLSLLAEDSSQVRWVVIESEVGGRVRARPGAGGGGRRARRRPNALARGAVPHTWRLRARATAAGGALPMARGPVGLVGGHPCAASWRFDDLPLLLGLAPRRPTRATACVQGMSQLTTHAHHRHTSARPRWRVHTSRLGCRGPKERARPRFTRRAPSYQHDEVRQAAREGASRPSRGHPQGLAGTSRAAVVRCGGRTALGARGLGRPRQSAYGA